MKKLIVCLALAGLSLACFDNKHSSNFRGDDLSAQWKFGGLEVCQSSDGQVTSRQHVVAKPYWFYTHNGREFSVAWVEASIPDGRAFHKEDEVISAECTSGVLDRQSRRVVVFNDRDGEFLEEVEVQCRGSIMPFDFDGRWVSPCDEDK